MTALPEKLEKESPPQRLCNEIRLFDICDLDQERCSYKQGKFCGSAGMLHKFEEIAEEEFRTPELISEEIEEEIEEYDEDSFDLDEDYDGGEAEADERY